MNIRLLHYVHLSNNLYIIKPKVEKEKGMESES